MAISKIDLQMMRTFEAGTNGLKADVAKMPLGLARRLFEQEIDLRERRLRQWKDNPSGDPETLRKMKGEDAPSAVRFKSVTGY